MPAKIKRIGILTGGGDCPGLNAVIRAVVKKSIIDHGWEVTGFLDGFHGLVNNRARRLEYNSVSGILTEGGTVLGTSKTVNPYRYAIQRDGRLIFRDLSRRAIGNVRRNQLDALIVVGGDGTLGIANRLNEDGLRVVGVPKTIDNDLKGTDVTVGFYSAVRIATDAIDNLHATAESLHRVIILEVMGHRTGWIALFAGIAGGGDIILIPEIPYDTASVARTLLKRSRVGRKFSIVVVAEGAHPKGGGEVVRELVKESQDPARLGGIGFALAAEIKKITSLDTRVVVLGHLQRGGAPTSFDRVLATRFGVEAVNLVAARRFGRMAIAQGSRVMSAPLKAAAGGCRTIPPALPLIAAARSVGTSFGD